MDFIAQNLNTNEVSDSGTKQLACRRRLNSKFRLVSLTPTKNGPTRTELRLWCVLNRHRTKFSFLMPGAWLETLRCSFPAPFVLHVELNRPKNLNAFSRQFW